MSEVTLSCGCITEGGDVVITCIRHVGVPRPTMRFDVRVEEPIHMDNKVLVTL